MSKKFKQRHSIDKKSGNGFVCKCGKICTGVAEFITHVNMENKKL